MANEGQYILTVSQKDQVQGQFYDSSQFFNCVQDMDDKWFLFLSPGDITSVKDTEWDWILECPTGPFTPKPSPPFPG